MTEYACFCIHVHVYVSIRDIKSVQKLITPCDIFHEASPGRRISKEKISFVLREGYQLICTLLQEEHMGICIMLTYIWKMYSSASDYVFSKPH